MSDAPHGPHDLTWFHGCPYCGSATPPGVAACRVCAFPLQDDRAWRVSSLDQAIMDADRRRATLLAERNGLLSTHIPGLPSTHISGPRPTSTHISGPRPTSAPVARHAPELRRRDTQATLLALGGTLLGLAALVFAAVTWNHSGPTGKTLILLTVTAAAASSPWLLLRRGLRDTAETIAAVAAVMVAADALLVRHLVAPGLDGRSFWAVTTLALAAALVGYGRATRLTAPYVLAAAVAQLPVLLVAARVSHSFETAAAWIALLVAVDAAAWWFLRAAADPRARAGAVLAASVAGLLSVGVLLAVRAITSTWSSTGAVLVACADLLCFAAVLTVFPVASRRERIAGAGAGGVLALGAILTGVANVLRVDSRVGASTVLALGGGLVILAAASGLRSSGGTAFRTAFRTATLTSGTLALAGAVTLAGPLVAAATGDQLHGGPVAHLSVGLAVCLLVTVLAVALGTGLLLAEVGPMREFWPDVAGGGVAALTLALPLLVPGSSTAFALATFAVGATIVGAVLFSRRIHLVAHVLGTGLAAESAALVAHDNTALAIALAGVTALAVTSAVRNASRAANIVLAVMAASGALAAGWVAAGEPQVPAGLATLAVPLAVAAALVSMRHTARVGTTLAVEAAEAAAVVVGATAVAVVAALDGAGWFAWALALAGGAVLAQSVRPDRRQAWYGGLALLTVSSWTHLAVADVHLVEAYSLPVSFVVLAVGGYRRSRDTTVSSVQAFGSGLAGALLPSLFAGFADAALTRSVIVLVCAAAVAAIGAGLRLQAPLVVGSLVALADALWLAAPHVAALPRWVSLGAVGAALIFLGATYERRRFQAGQLAEHVRTFA